MRGPVLTTPATKRAFARAGLRLRPISVDFFWKRLGITPYPRAAFNPAVPENDPRGRPVSVIVAVFPNVATAFTAAKGYGPKHGACDSHLRVGNVLLVWAHPEDARLRAAIRRLR
jgi:hypothetical protein